MTVDKGSAHSNQDSDSHNLPQRPMKRRPLTRREKAKLRLTLSYLSED